MTYGRSQGLPFFFSDNLVTMAFAFAFDSLTKTVIAPRYVWFGGMNVKPRLS